MVPISLLRLSNVVNVCCYEQAKEESGGGDDDGDGRLRLLSVLSYPNFWWGGRSAEVTRFRSEPLICVILLCVFVWFGVCVKGGCAGRASSFAEFFPASGEQRSKKPAGSKTTRTTKPQERQYGFRSRLIV